ncbi:Rhodocoxin reductase [bacterium HR18]|jgi:NADPH-dependent 2,4-dienoyl-CoA reductase/sulfur reductase-like enzyme/nitrite reductase/ring-hydroxylating ferredoxin subunit|uniref:Pyridine nucleotide-disulfide oxidoreductase n=1 Tax=Rhodothermus marinus TaxID=29549 RepID=A0A7V2B0K4_RHOMR|nr:Rhodocoxin reductase [bacterium HR18]
MPAYRVARVDALADGQMKQVKAGQTDVLLVRLAGQVYALGAHCTHYSAPLATGVLQGERIICPWHHACFHARTGEHLEPPGLDHLPTFTVRIEGESIWVEVPEDVASHRLPALVRRDVSDGRTCVVVGSGCAGAYAVEALRAQGFTGRVLWITGAEFPPIDRPNLSKAYLSGEAPEEWMPLRPSAFYAAADVELIQDNPVVRLDATARRITLADGETLPYDVAILAPGAVPRRLEVPGAELSGIFTLRTLDDSRALRAAAQQARRAVVVGASFIGMEAAQSLRHLGLEVTVVAPEAVPFERTLGAPVGHVFQTLHEEHGVRFRLGRTVKAFAGEERVAAVILDDGSELAADLVVVGVGVEPATDFVEGVAKAPDGSILVDAYLQAGEGLFVAGDAARFPDWRTGSPIRIEHWQTAAQLGRLAGANAAGRRQPYQGVPFFWTRQFGVSLQYVGYAGVWDQVVLEGDPSARRFLAYYVRDEAVWAIAGMGRGREMAILHGLLWEHPLPALDLLQDALAAH